MTEFIMQTVQPFVGALSEYLVVFLIAMAIAYLKKRWNIDVKAETVAKLEKFAIDAIYLAEEKGARELAAGVEGKLAGWKHYDAVEKLLAMAPKLTRDEASDLVETIVARLPDIGAFRVK